MRSDEDGGVEAGAGKDGWVMSNNGDAWAEEGNGEEGRAKTKVEA